MRKLATIRKINNLLPIDGADLIMTAVIDGWTVVVKKDEFKVGDRCVYFEIDSFLPDGNPAWQHLVDKHPRTFEGCRGHKLKTVRLRGQLSQGFAAPVGAFVDAFIDSDMDEGQELSEFFFVGNDLTEFLNIKKWEAVIPAELAGKVRGNFPTFIPKTDQERCQNLGSEIFVDNKDARYEVTMKMDGASFTCYLNNTESGVCSRNWNLTLDETNHSNSLIRMYIDSGLQDVMAKYGKNIAIQGELMGPGIQTNRENLTCHTLFIFDIYDIDAAAYLPPADRHNVVTQLCEMGLNIDMVRHVPIIGTAVSLEDLGVSSISGLLELADGPSLVHLIMEGHVYKRMDGKFSFKVINNKFLLKEKDVD